MPQKVGAVFYGLLVGAGVAILTSLTLGLLGLVPSLMASAGWIHLGEYQPWLPIAGLMYGFFLGVIIGAVVCWRFCLSRLQSPN